MAEKKYYKVNEAAEFLGVSEDEIRRLMDNRDLYGYRDGADWKFKAEDIEKLAHQQSEVPEPLAIPDDDDLHLGDDSDVLLSEVELGESDPGASGTVIGGDVSKDSMADSDIQLGEESAISSADGDVVESKVSDFEELDLALEEDLTLEDSQSAAASDSGTGDSGAGNSTVDLGGGELADELADELDDDDLVLGGSGAGSDITIGGDSGISLIDPADSGLSLEEPLDLSGDDAESLVLGEDDMLSLADDSSADVQADDDFLLTPLEEVDEEDSESGSQVIALDPEDEGMEAATMISNDGGMAAMLEEDLAMDDVADLGAGVSLDADPLGGQPGALGAGQAVAATATLPETPYTTWNIVSLAFCVLLLILCGMFMTDLAANMHSWTGSHPVNSWIMDWILGLF